MNKNVFIIFVKIILVCFILQMISLKAFCQVSNKTNSTHKDISKKNEELVIKYTVRASAIMTPIGLLPKLKPFGKFHLVKI